ncbi:MAG TPA: hypothetical protein VES88_17410 [Gemmatimonadaceae bacterium]|nr:hypothetical protein [Gemmatimonadaceae bacterium]
MERTNRIAQIYGYAVCLVAIIAVLISVTQIVNAAFNLVSPLRAEGYGRGGPLTSYTAYKREQLQRVNAPERARAGVAARDSGAVPTDAEIRQMYEDERLEQIGNVRFRAMRTLVTSTLLIIIASGLFFMHWRWLRREDQTA